MGIDVIAVVSSAIVVFSDFVVVSGVVVCSIDVVCPALVEVGFNVVAVVSSVVGISFSVVAMEPLTTSVTHVWSVDCPSLSVAV